MKIKFKNIIPPLSQEELDQLEQNIIADGIREPLVLWGDVLIDGHNRYNIAQKHGLKYPTVQKEFESDEDAELWIIKNQLGRRNLTDFVRAEVALKYEEVIKKKAKENQKLSEGRGQKGFLNSKNLNKVNTHGELADIAGVSKDTIWKTKVIKEEGSEEVQDQVRKGEISLNKAFTKTRPVKAKIINIKENVEIKTCIICGKEKRNEEFVMSRGNYTDECKQCSRERQISGLTRVEAIELNKMFPDVDIKKPPSDEPESSNNEKYIRNPIIAEFEQLLNDFNNKVKKFIHMPQVKSKETKELTNETITILNKIII